ncbi:thiamine-phosphate kinase [bacterium]
MNEFDIIENIKKWVSSKEKQTSLIGIGDDAAVIPPFKDKLLISKDALVEGVHFTRNITSFYELGWKALSVNLSDIAAMGGMPLFALISFACPARNIKLENLKDFYNGFRELADLASGLQLIGGDTVKSKSDIFISVTILGKCLGGKPILRNNAQDQDYICATGTFGDAAFGLEKLLAGENIDSFFANRFNKPTPRFREGIIIGENQLANAMMDVSDGLSFTLHEMAEKSDKKFEIYYDKIPVSKNLKQNSEKFMDYALYGGEDYELIFCAPQKKLEDVKNLIPNATVIGRVKNGDGVKFLNSKGEAVCVERKGYNAYNCVETPNLGVSTNGCSN